LVPRNVSVIKVRLKEGQGCIATIVFVTKSCVAAGLQQIIRGADSLPFGSIFIFDASLMWVSLLIFDASLIRVAPPF